MSHKRIAVIVSSVAVAAAGGGAALAATAKDEPGGAEQAVIDNAAKRLNVSPQALRDALGGALDDQLAQAVKDGRLTQEQADAIKRRRAGGAPLLGGPGGGPGHRERRDLVLGLRGPAGGESLAKALGTTPAKLREQLRGGRTIAEIAKANGKDLADVKKALSDELSARLDKAVAADRLTRQQSDQVLKRAGEAFDRFATSKPSERRRGWHGGPLGGGPGGPGGDALSGVAL